MESNFLKKEFESYEDYRNELGKLIRLEMLGPNKSDSEEDKNRQIRISPDQQFSCGILFPVETTLADTNTQSEMHDEFLSEIESDDIKIENKNMETNSKNFHEDDDPEPSLDLSNQHSPSSIAITFKRNKKNPILVEINFSKYFPSLTEDENKYPVYTRKQYEYSLT